MPEFMVAILLVAILMVGVFALGYWRGKKDASTSDKYLDKYVTMMMEAFKAEEFDPIRGTELRNAANQLLQARYGSRERLEKLLGIGGSTDDGNANNRR